MGSHVVVCAGLITVDYVYALPEFPNCGIKTRAQSAEIVPGGGAFTAAAAIAAQGGHAVLAGVIGNDAHGQFLRQEITRRGIDDRLLQIEDRVSTASSAVLITGQGERTVVNHRSDALMATPAKVSRDFVFDAVLADTRWVSGAVPYFERAELIDSPAILDAEAPLDGTSELMGKASHVIFSEQGLAAFRPGQKPRAALKSTNQNLGGWIAVTRGSEPVLSVQNGKFSKTPTVPVTPINTLGAGDVWHGSFALALAQRRNEGEATAWANAATAHFVSVTGDDRFPTATQVELTLRSQKL